MGNSDITSSPQWRAAKLWLTANGSQPPLLITGASKNFLTTIINELALHAVCENVENEPCRTCKHCHQVVTQIHPDIITYTPSTLTIPIKEVRSLLRRLARTAIGPRRLVVIYDIHRLSIPSANALLKALEEPSSSTRYVLATSWPQRLLPTILSRCQKLRFHQHKDQAKQLEKSTKAWQEDVLKRLAAYDSKEPLDEATLHEIADALTEQLRQSGPTPTLRLALLRLRDYYRITGARGNEKFARDVLLTSLP